MHKVWEATLKWDYVGNGLNRCNCPGEGHQKHECSAMHRDAQQYRRLENEARPPFRQSLEIPFFGLNRLRMCDGYRIRQLLRHYAIHLSLF